MAVFRYIGDNGLYDPAKPFSVSLVDSAGTSHTYTFTSGVDFTVSNDESVISSLEFHIDPITKSSDFLRIS